MRLKLNSLVLRIANNVSIFSNKISGTFFRKRSLLLTNADLKKNESLKNKFSGKSCYVLGNAPSIEKHDLLRLKDQHVICCNNFFLHKDFKEIKPDFYVIADADFLDLSDEKTSAWWKQMIEKTSDTGLTYFLPIQVKDTFIHTELKDEKVHFLDMCLPFYDNCVSNFDIGHAINGVQNVLVLAIQLSIYMGFENVFLLGADHNWLSHYGEQRHFYKQDETDEIGSTGYSYHWWLKAVGEMFRQYEMLHKFARERGIRILNASEAGVLDVFPSIKFKDTFIYAEKNH